MAIVRSFKKLTIMTKLTKLKAIKQIQSLFKDVIVLRKYINKEDGYIYESYDDVVSIVSDRIEGSKIHYTFTGSGVDIYHESHSHTKPAISVVIPPQAIILETEGDGMVQTITKVNKKALLLGFQIKVKNDPLAEKELEGMQGNQTLAKAYKKEITKLKKKKATKKELKELKEVIAGDKELNELQKMNLGRLL